MLAFCCIYNRNRKHTGEIRWVKSVEYVRIYNAINSEQTAAKAYLYPLPVVLLASPAREPFFWLSLTVPIAMLFHDDDYSSAKFKLPIEPSPIKAAKYGTRWSWKPKVRPSLGCRCHIAKTISYISVFFILSIQRLTGLWTFKCQGHLMSLWP